jgi:rhodanese-related sulfurtransferase
MHNPQGKKAFLEAICDVVAGDTAHPIALICAVGGRPRGAQRFLAENG